MRRTLTVLVTAAALLVPATAASAAPPEPKSNASCNSGQQRGPEGSTYNGKGNISECGGVRVTPPKDDEDDGEILYT
jgi:hypothetical protein